MALKKILIDGQRLAKLRARAGYTQEMLAEKLELSKRTVQRLEDPDTESRLSFYEMSQISRVLRVWMSAFWGELPLEYRVHGFQILDADDFSKTFDRCVEAGKFDIEHIPNDEEIESAIINLSKLYDIEKQQLPVRRNRSVTQKLEHTVHLRKLFRTCTNNNRVDKIDFYTIPSSCAYIDMEREQILWLHTINIIGVAAGSEQGVSRNFVSSDCVSPDHDQEGKPILDEHGEQELSIMANQMGGGEQLKEQILAARPDIIVGGISEDTEYFSEFENRNEANIDSVSKASVEKETKNKK